MNPGKYQEKYRIASARLAGWDYGSNATYFITLCTQNRVHAFGEVIDNEVDLNSLGQVAWDCWHAIPEHFPFVALDKFVAMPNHVHGILRINKSSRDGAPSSINQFGPQAQNLGSIVRGFKIGVTKFARQHQLPFDWQPRYHDHIIRDAASLERIRQYIVENPQKWAEDCFYTS